MKGGFDAYLERAPAQLKTATDFVRQLESELR